MNTTITTNVTFTTPKRINDGEDADGNPICYYCGSEALLKDAFATWNKETKDWEISSVYDFTVCTDCDEEQ